MHTPNTVTIIGLDFIDAYGDRITSTQLVVLGVGQAIATATFRNGKLTGHRATADADVGRFMQGSSACMENSVPQTFKPGFPISLP